MAHLLQHTQLQAGSTSPSGTPLRPGNPKPITDHFPLPVVPLLTANLLGAGGQALCYNKKQTNKQNKTHPQRYTWLRTSQPCASQSSLGEHLGPTLSAEYVCSKPRACLSSLTKGLWAPAVITNLVLFSLFQLAEPHTPCRKPEQRLDASPAESGHAGIGEHLPPVTRPPCPRSTHYKLAPSWLNFLAVSL